MAQYEVFPNPGTQGHDIPFLLAIQNDHIVRYTGATVVVPLRAHMDPVEAIAPLVEVPGHGHFVLSVAEILTIDSARLRHAVGILSLEDRAKIRPALDKVIGDY